MPYLSEIRIFSFAYAPKGWAQCNGQSLLIVQNQPLFSLIGITFGGDGTRIFNLPDFRGKSPMNWNQRITWGQTGGEAAHALSIDEIPAHKHLASASSNGPDVNSAAHANWATNTGFTPYGNNIVTAMNAQALLTMGLGVPHDNMSPFLTLNICIALVGIFPTRG